MAYLFNHDEAITVIAAAGAPVSDAAVSAP